MSGEVQAADLAAFLRDVTEATARQQLTVDAQTRNGFAFWCQHASGLDGVRSPYLDAPDAPPPTFLEVRRPGPEPQPPRSLFGDDVDPEALRRYRELHGRWVQHKSLYDDLFAARTPSETMELVVATGLLVTLSDQGELRRHLVTAPAEVLLDRVSGLIRVTTTDAFMQEVNWTPGEIREHLVDPDSGLNNLVEAQTHGEAMTAVARIASSFGSEGEAQERPDVPFRRGVVGVGATPAVLLRHRDVSSLLELLRDMADDMADGGFVSEPFKMLASPTFRPSVRETLNDRAALPLSANNEQRDMIDRARREAHMVVQGPPGTGKTHTIANLVAVLMAEGRRVLVTAENDRALTEVQSKLPVGMRPLMLPMLRERGTGALQASVNALSSRASATNTKDDRQRAIDEQAARLSAVEGRIAAAARKLKQIALADDEERTFHQTTMRMAGHQQALSGEQDRLKLVDQYLSGDGYATAADDASVLELTGVVSEAHEQMRQFQLPSNLKEPSELALWIRDHRGQLAVLGDPTDYDHAALADRIDDIAHLSRMLQALPPTPWSEINRTSEEYAAAAALSAEVASGVDHGVTVEPKQRASSAVTVMEAYLALDPARFDRPIDELIAEYERARAHVDDAATVGEFSDHESATLLIQACESALALLDSDRSGLLVAHVLDHRNLGHSSIDLLVREAHNLLPGSRAPLGLPVLVDDGAPPAHELLRQAEILRAHLDAGGKMTKAIGTPRPVKDAAQLIATVQIDGSPIDTPEEAARAVEFFAFRKTVALIDAWAGDHQLSHPPGVAHHEWLAAITGVPAASQRVRAALDLAGRLVAVPFGFSLDGPEASLRIALATVSHEIATALQSFAEAVFQQDIDLRIAGMPVRSQAEAERALASLRAGVLRQRQHELLPSAWAGHCNPLDTDEDMLVRMLRVCAAAARLPSKARAAELTPTSVNRIAERAQADARRHQLGEDYERVIGGLRRTLAACVPMSPATRAIDEALASENPRSYRVGLEELAREGEMADQAARLEAARNRVGAAHPRLLTAFDIGDQTAVEVLGSLQDLQDLRDYRKAVEAWKAEIGSSQVVHDELSLLHGELQRVEQKLAELRCWSTAVGRLQGRRELSSSLSALTIAMDKVPKTRSAKSYAARMRGLRAATRAAAPAIPCWVMAIDRVAEVLGYPRGEDRFDVVIVDEASQAWFPSMFLYAIADQVIVVGDDLQTSPSQVVNEAEVRSIVHEHIAGHRLADQVGADLSLYDVAAVITGPDTMVDHFRCVPEIIELSNRLSYGPKGKRLLPSRVREPGSLDPVKHVRVEGERFATSGANHEEVEAVVRQVAQCHADPRYRGMDFGVVVVGTTPNAHLKALMTLLLDEIGPIAMEQRNLEIGTPSQFQGAERHVMFLSMLDAPREGERLRKWPHEHAGRNRTRVQQLNVAVSRARDQLWVFRSFDASHLAPDDARAVLLQSGSSSIPTLAEQLEKCDSDFERDVVTALAAARPDLVIRTQVEAIGYLIDIVIEDGRGRRLAVECDGDRWHTADHHIRADLHRQRTLESVGWRFDRFLASEWYDDPVERTAAILQHLESLAPVEVRSQPQMGDGVDGTHESSTDLGDASADIASGDDENADEDQRRPEHWFDALADDEFADDDGLQGEDGWGEELDDDKLEDEQDWSEDLDEATVRGAATGQPVLSTARQETLVCEACGDTWNRDLVRGRKPRYCPDCR